MYFFQSFQAFVQLSGCAARSATADCHSCRAHEAIVAVTSYWGTEQDMGKQGPQPSLSVDNAACVRVPAVTGPVGKINTTVDINVVKPQPKSARRELLLPLLLVAAAAKVSTVPHRNEMQAFRAIPRRQDIT
jgi:hypothetical protein